MKINTFKSHDESSRALADKIVSFVKNKPNTTICFATGSSTEKLYEYLIQDYKEGKVSFENVKAFNLDEYIGLKPSHPQSYHFYMFNKLFNHINIKKENINIPKGIGDIEANIKDYQDLLDNHTIDIQILGIGTNAHIGFNEPGTPFDSKTAKVKLTDSTINSNKVYFTNKQQVPKEAISMGIASILKAKNIFLIAGGKNKAQAIYDCVKTSPSTDVPASSLQNHNSVKLYLDIKAASML